MVLYLSNKQEQMNFTSTISAMKQAGIKYRMTFNYNYHTSSNLSFDMIQNVVFNNTIETNTPRSGFTPFCFNDPSNAHHFPI
jgi:hypothetical protein